MTEPIVEPAEPVVADDSLMGGLDTKEIEGEIKLGDDFYNEDKTLNPDKVLELQKSFNETTKRSEGLRKALGKGVEKAPESVEGYALAEELTDKMDAEHPTLKAFKEGLLELGYGNDKFQEIAAAVMGKLDLEAVVEGAEPSEAAVQANIEKEAARKEEEMKSLGEDGPKMLYGIEQFGKQQVEKGIFTPEMAQELNNMIVSAESAKVAHALVSQLSEQPLPTVQSASGLPSKSEYEAQLMAKDDKGESKMQDPAYAAEMMAKGEKLRKAGML